MAQHTASGERPEGKEGEECGETPGGGQRRPPGQGGAGRCSEKPYTKEALHICLHPSSTSWPVELQEGRQHLGGLGEVHPWKRVRDYSGLNSFFLR